MREILPLLNRLCSMVERVIGRLRGRLPGSSGVPTGPQHAPRIPTREEFDRYVDGLVTREPNYGSPGAREFQQSVAGNPEYRVGDGDRAVWADGLTYDPSAGGVVVEAKFVDNPGGSSIHEGTAPPFILDQAMAGFDDEVARYAEAITDGSNPLARLDVIVSTPEARDFLGNRIAGVMEELAANGSSQIPWSITVRSEVSG